MSFLKRSVGTPMTSKEAQTLIEKEPYMYGYLPRNLQTPDLLNICNDGWRDRLYNSIMHYKEHPDELKAIMKTAKSRGL